MKIELWPMESECCVCGRYLVGCKKGIPMYEGCAVPNDWAGEWAGFDACDECWDRRERGEMPTWPQPPNAKYVKLNRGVENGI